MISLALFSSGAVISDAKTSDASPGSYHHSSTGWHDIVNVAPTFTACVGMSRRACGDIKATTHRLMTRAFSLFPGAWQASPSVYDRMLKLEPVSSILRFKRTDNYRRYYDKASVDVCAGLCLAPAHAEACTAAATGN